MITLTITLDPFYIIVIALIAICFLDILYVSILKPIINKNRVKNKLLYHISKSNLSYDLSKTNIDGSDFKLLINGKKYLIKVVIVPKNCDLQINNIDTWVCYMKASGDSMKTKLINNLTRFMNSKQDNRIVILSNSAKTIKKVINECEMIMVKPNTDVYKINIINFNQIGDFINNN